MNDRAVSSAMRAALDGCASACRAWPEQEEGPYHRAAPPVRRDVVEDAPGLELVLGVRLLDDRRTPLTDATVEIWQCDALGRYSGFPPPAGIGAPATQPTSPDWSRSTPRARYEGG